MHSRRRFRLFFCEKPSAPSLRCLRVWQVGFDAKICRCRIMHESRDVCTRRTWRTWAPANPVLASCISTSEVGFHNLVHPGTPRCTHLRSIRAKLHTRNAHRCMFLSRPADSRAECRLPSLAYGVHMYIPFMHALYLHAVDAS